jgi:hypothetical protein
MDSARSALLIMDVQPEIVAQPELARLAQSDAFVEGRSSNLHPGSRRNPAMWCSRSAGSARSQGAIST